MMPYKDGYTLAKIREKQQEVPIIFHKIDERGCFKGYKAGADDYLNKPFDSEY
jgi:DNA-binding response OmpR family regulator